MGAALVRSWCCGDCRRGPQTEEREVPSYADLPEGVLVTIFGNLSRPEVARLSTVCRSFAEAAKSDLLWEKWLPPDFDIIAENAYGGPLQYDSLKELYELFNQHVVLGDEGHQGFGTEPVTGAFYLTFGARTLSIRRGSDERCWQWLPAADVPRPRYAEVAYLRPVCLLTVYGEVKLRLPPGTYSLRWVLKFPSGDPTVTKPSDFITFDFTDRGVSYQHSDIVFPQGAEEFEAVAHGREELHRSISRMKWKEDAWLEHIAGHFAVPRLEDRDPAGDGRREVHLRFELCVDNNWWTNNILLDGIVIRQQPESNCGHRGTSDRRSAEDGTVVRRVLQNMMRAVSGTNVGDRGAR
ncbi:hypothetical protein R1sor_013867 [Riccia sorocarpa]|uniref:F-box domain-containing protein n=1 Tax=Riccia sorocarpa TaxID=122646 RepID=A0ABD3H7S8_9MARC